MIDRTSIADAHQRAADEWKAKHPGKEYGDLHARWWTDPKNVPYVADTFEILEAIVAALIQEGNPAWHGDATSIISHMIRAQSDLRKAAETELERLHAAAPPPQPEPELEQVARELREQLQQFIKINLVGPAGMVFIPIEAEAAILAALTAAAEAGNERLRTALTEVRLLVANHFFDADVYAVIDAALGRGQVMNGYQFHLDNRPAGPIRQSWNEAANDAVRDGFAVWDWDGEGIRSTDGMATVERIAAEAKETT